MAGDRHAVPILPLRVLLDDFSEMGFEVTLVLREAVRIEPISRDLKTHL